MIDPPTTQGLLRAANMLGCDGDELLSRSDQWHEWRRDKRPVSTEYQLAIRVRDLYADSARSRFTALRLLITYGMESMQHDRTMLMHYLLGRS